MLILCIVVSLNPKNEITRIDFARSGAWSDRGAAFSVDTSLIYKYYGKGIDGAQHCYVGRVSRSFWDTLNRKLESISYKTMDSIDRPRFGTMDANYFELIVHWKNNRRRIIKVRALGGIDSATNKVFEWLSNSHKLVNMQQIQDTIKFETTYQRGGLDADWQKIIDLKNKSGRYP